MRQTSREQHTDAETSFWNYPSLKPVTQRKEKGEKGQEDMDIAVLRDQCLSQLLPQGCRPEPMGADPETQSRTLD